MAKPICVIRVGNVDFGNGMVIDANDLRVYFEEKLNDYHVFVIPLGSYQSNEPIQFQVFHEKDFDEIKYEELKDIITDAMDKYKANEPV